MLTMALGVLCAKRRFNRGELAPAKNSRFIWQPAGNLSLLVSNRAADSMARVLASN